MDNVETTTVQDIRITEKAAEQVKKLLAENNLDDSYYLRIAIKGGGCSGFQYSLALDNQITPLDSTYDVESIKIVIDGKSLFYISGTEIDYTDDVTAKGFVFNNPNSKQSCGCGC